MPAGWGYGNLSTWCLNGKSEPGTPVVERPGGVVESIACMGPENGYGVQFLDGSLADMAYAPGELWQYEPGDATVYPDGAWLGYQRSGDNLVLVVARSPSPRPRPCSARWSGASTRSGRQRLRCPARPRLRRMSPTGTVRLCRYYGSDGLAGAERAADRPGRRRRGGGPRGRSRNGDAQAARSPSS